MKMYVALISLLAGLLLGPPASAQTSLLGDIHTPGSVTGERARFPLGDACPTVIRDGRQQRQCMTPAQVAQVLNTVAWAHRFEGWGMLRKGAGNSCPIAGTFISCDILIHAPSVTHWDVLQDSEGAANPRFDSVGPCVLGPASGCAMSNFMAPVDPGTGAAPSPAPTPTSPAPRTTSTDSDALFELLVEHDQNDQERVERLFARQEERDERIFGDLVARLTELKSLILTLPSQSAPVQSAPIIPALSVIPNNGGGFWTFVGKYVLPAVGGVVAGVAAQ